MSVLEIKSITKRFGSLVANDEISLSLGAGEVLALLGENGAGKTTLMNILFGHYVADSGVITINGSKLAAGKTNAAIKAGVGMVHQHFTLADNLSVLDNIMLGTESLLAWRSNLSRAKVKLQSLADEFGLSVDPEAMVSDLSVGERQRVEILKVLYRDAKILILDEPTAVLTPQEAELLLAILKTMVEKGLSIIFISHKLHEVLSISDRINVLRRGKMVGEIDTENADRDVLVEMMVGRNVKRPEVEHMPQGPVIVELAKVSVAGKEGHKLALDNIDLKIHGNQIIGLAGVAGNGQAALGRLLSGLDTPLSGHIHFESDPVTEFSAQGFVDLGIGRIPEDRHVTGVVGDMSIWENFISEDLRKRPFWKGGFWINFSACRHFADDLIKRFDVRCENMDMPAKQLSGGNMQKLILARVLHKNPKFILANQPVRGLDEGAIAAVHQRLLEAKKAGAGVLLVSEDLDELLGLADKIAVIYHGKISQCISTRTATASDIGIMMAGDLEHAQTLINAEAIL